MIIYSTHQSQELSSLSKTQLDLRSENSNPIHLYNYRPAAAKKKPETIYTAQFVRGNYPTNCSTPGVKMSSWHNPFRQSHSTHLMSAGELLRQCNQLRVRGESHAVIICTSHWETYLDFSSIRSSLLFKQILQISSYIFRNIEHNIGDQQLYLIIYKSLKIT